MSERGGNHLINRVKTYTVLAVGAVLISPAVGLDDEVTALIHGSAAVEQNNNSSGYEYVPINEIGQNMQNDLTHYKRVNPHAAYSEAKSTGEHFGHLYGESLSVSDVMRYYYIAGFRGEDLKIMTAIAGKESSYYPAALGDIDWVYDGDRSIGLSGMYCSPNGPIGCSDERNWIDNFDPQTNANNAHVLYVQSIRTNGRGSGDLKIDGAFKPWESDPDRAREFLSATQETYSELEAMYGNLG